MDQNDLRFLENRCVQDDPPECTASCPIHVDARAFVGHMSRGKPLDAWKVLQKTMPFPGILGRICDAPCQTRCRRKDVDQAILTEKHLAISRCRDAGLGVVLVPMIVPGINDHELGDIL